MGKLTITKSRVERRAAARFKLYLPVVFRWRDGSDFVDGGFTNEISRNDAYVLSDHCPPEGSEVRIEVLIPPSDNFFGPLRLESVGRVTQLVRENGCTGFLFQGLFDDDHISCFSNY
jgi:hypothetical protein